MNILTFRQKKIENIYRMISTKMLSTLVINKNIKYKFIGK